MSLLHYLSIFLEAVVVVISLMLAVAKKKSYGWGLALTFALYVFYDFARLNYFQISDGILFPLFFLATVSALWSVWKIYNIKDSLG